MPQQKATISPSSVASSAPKRPSPTLPGAPKPGTAVPAGLLAQVRAQKATGASSSGAHQAQFASQPLPLQHQMTVNALGKAVLELVQSAGGMSAPTKGALLTCDLLRQLDSNPMSCPPWLQKADARAVRELVKWFDQRGFLQPEVEDDPGEPDEGQDRIDDLLLLPRPNPETKVERLVEYLKCRRSVVYFIDNYCSVRDKQRGIIPFRLWRWQAWMLCRWHTNDLSIALKARQIGVSECAAGYSHWLLRFYDTKEILFISKSQEDAIYLLDRVRVMGDYLPDWLQAGRDGALNPDGLDAVLLSNNNTREYVLNHQDRKGRPHESSISSSAATVGAGRGKSPALVILDEQAHMLWGAEIWDSVKYATDYGKVFVISTAFGMGNIFHVLWVGATDKEGNTNGFYPMFFGWARHPERDQTWYNRQEATATRNGKLPEFHQECPRDPTEAFIQSGRPVFDQTYLTAHALRIREEMAARRGDGEPDWQEIDGLTIYEEAIPGHLYIIGADTAGGGANGDFDDASVVDRQTGREVACLHGRWPAEVFAASLDELGHRYNMALLAVERNNTFGGAVLADLLSGRAHAPAHQGKDLPYPNLYHYKSDLVPGRMADARPGWETNIRTKPMMLKSMQQALREDAYLPRSLKFLDEALVFAFDETGTKSSAPAGMHDDMVISRCIAIHLLLQPDRVALALTMVQSMRTSIQAKAQNRRATTAPGLSSGLPGKNAPIPPPAPTPAIVA